MITTKPAFKIKLAGYPELKIQLLSNNVVNVITPTLLTEKQLHLIVKYLHREGFCDENQLKE